MQVETVDPYRVSCFEEFWPHYVRLHQRPETQHWHAAATCSSALLLGLGIVLARPLLLVAAPLANHLIAQASHRKFEQNKTLPWKNFAWHTRAELRMLRLVLKGRMQAEVRRWV